MGSNSGVQILYIADHSNLFGLFFLLLAYFLANSSSLHVALRIRSSVINTMRIDLEKAEAALLLLVAAALAVAAALLLAARLALLAALLLAAAVLATTVDTTGFGHLYLLRRFFIWATGSKVDERSLGYRTMYDDKTNSPS